MGKPSLNQFLSSAVPATTYQVQTGTLGSAVISDQEDPASKVYVGQKQKRALEIGYAFKMEGTLPALLAREEFGRTIEFTTKDPQTHGLLLQLPLQSIGIALSAMHSGQKM